jgi:hypothetical protein
VVPVRREELLVYVGGQMLIVKCGQAASMFCGEIAQIVPIGSNEICFKMKWMAKGDGDRWKVTDKLEHRISMEVFIGYNVGPEQSGGDCVFMFSTKAKGDWIVLYPPDGSRLDRASVEGLELH